MPKAEECKFAKTHEWAFSEGDVATVGISDFAQHEVSDIVFVELPQVGDSVSAGKSCAVIESVKAASDFYAPVSGEVIETNSAVVDEPSLVNRSAQEEGWFFKIKMSKPEELSALMDYKAYQESIK
ncbi:MAG: glycine cleavage system protein GcvH [Elusimicrobiaceae bacterium]|jgi:glycine cleavage system H protein